MADVDNLFDSDDEEEQHDKELQQQLEDSDEPIAEADDELQDADDGGYRGDVGAQDDEEVVDEAEELRRQEDAKPPIELELPLVPLPARQELHLMKLSNVISAETKPYDPQTFSLEQESYMDEQGKERLRLRTGNVVRWRYRKTASGRLEKQSNARFVKWSDGSLQLLLGDEVFNIKKQDIAGDNSYLFVSNAGILQAHVPLESKLLVQPTDLNSATHRRLAELSRSRHTRVTKVAAHAVLANPEKEMNERMKAEQEQNTARAQLDRARAAEARKFQKPPPTNFNARYLEDALDEEDGGGEYVGAEPSRRRGYDEAGEAERSRRLQAAKRNAPPAKRKRAEESEDEDFIESEEEEEEPEAEDGGSEEEEAGEAEEEEEEERPRKGREQARPAAKPVEAAKPKARKGVVVSSDEED